MAAEIVSARAGLARRSQRLGVTPLVLLLKRSGKASARSRTVVLRKSSEWIAATPFVLWEPTIARFAMRICFTCPSSTRLVRAARPASPGKRARMSSSSRRLISKMISSWRGMKMFHPLDRPALQRLGKQSMVGVGERPLRDVPRLVPTQMRFVEQNAHELRHGEARMRVVELDGGLLGQHPPIGIRLAKSANRVGERTGDEEIFLHQAESAALARMVVRIKDARQRFRVERFGDRRDEIAAAEPLKVERVRGGGAPQAKRVDRLAAVTDHWPVIGDADQRRGGVRNHAQRARAQFERAGERHLDALGGAHHLPRIGMAQPIVRALLLPAVANSLPEDAMLVAQSVAHRRQLHRRHRVRGSRPPGGRDRHCPDPRRAPREEFPTTRARARRRSARPRDRA